MKRLYDFDPVDGIAHVTFIIGDKKFRGTAICHEQDKDMMSEKTGLYLAEQRATIAYLQDVRDNDIKPKLQMLEHIYDGFQQSKYFNEKSYESRFIRRQIRFLENDLTTINETLAETRKNITRTIIEKDKFYRDVRRHRTKNQEEKVND